MWHRCTTAPAPAVLSEAEPTFPEFLPLPDSEAAAAVRRLADAHIVRFALLSGLHPKWPRLLRWLLSRHNAVLLRHQLRAIDTVAAFQNQVANWLHRALAHSADEISDSGFSELELDRPTLFVGNHRDIALDGVLLDLTLLKYGAQTVRLAIGDNLFHPPLMADFFRINRGFSVQREATSRRQAMRHMAAISSYIRTSLSDGISVWIAQNSGRAKDGMDRTTPSLLYMLTQAWRPLPFPDIIRQLRVVPVACSYEYDPCTAEKAQACLVAEQSAGGRAMPTAGSSAPELLKGLSGHKGRIHIAAGTALDGEYADQAEAAAAIDRQIHRLFRLYPQNIIAAQQLEGAAWPEDFRDVFDPEAPQAVTDRTIFERHMAALAAELHPYALRALANPVINARIANRD